MDRKAIAGSWLLVPVLFVMQVVANSGHAQCDSTGAVMEQAGEQTVATASASANLLKRDGSLRREAERMLSEAARRLDDVATCAPSCKAVTPTTIRFSAVPKVFLSDYPDRTRCEQHLSRTKLSPLLYSDRRFSSIEQVSSWFGDLSQGKGTDGADLYRRCDGSCSPQFTLAIERAESGYQVNASIVCGHARDKSDNNYDLSYRFLWQCRAK